MKKVFDHISPFRLMAFFVILLAVWLVGGNGGPHGYGKLFSGVLVFFAIVIFLLDALINTLIKNSRKNSYLIQLTVMSLVLIWIYLKAS